MCHSDISHVGRQSMSVALHVAIEIRNSITFGLTQPESNALKYYPLMWTLKVPPLCGLPSNVSPLRSKVDTLDVIKLVWITLSYGLILFMSRSLHGRGHRHRDTSYHQHLGQQQPQDPHSDPCPRGLHCRAGGICDSETGPTQQPGPGRVRDRL